MKDSLHGYTAEISNNDAGTPPGGVSSDSFGGRNRLICRCLEKLVATWCFSSFGCIWVVSSSSNLAYGGYSTGSVWRMVTERQVRWQGDRTHRPCLMWLATIEVCSSSKLLDFLHSLPYHCFWWDPDEDLVFALIKLIQELSWKTWRCLSLKALEGAISNWLILAKLFLDSSQILFWGWMLICWDSGTAFLLVATWSIGNLLFASTKPGFEKGQRSRLLLNTDGREWVDCLELCKSFRPSPRLSNVKTQRYTKSFAFAFGCRSTMWVEELLAQLVEPSEGVLIRCELWTGSSFVS